MNKNSSYKFENFWFFLAICYFNIHNKLQVTLLQFLKIWTGIKYMVQMIISVFTEKFCLDFYAWNTCKQHSLCLTRICYFLNWRFGLVKHTMMKPDQRWVSYCVSDSRFCFNSAFSGRWFLKKKLFRKRRCWWNNYITFIVTV